MNTPTQKIGFHEFNLSDFADIEEDPSKIHVCFDTPIQAHAKIELDDVKIINADKSSWNDWLLISHQIVRDYQFPKCNLRSADLYLCMTPKGEIFLFPVMHPNDSMAADRYRDLSLLLGKSRKKPQRIHYNNKQFTSTTSTASFPDWPSSDSIDEIIFKLCNGYLVNSPKVVSSRNMALLIP